ncbi:hypothetical protein [Cellulomonas terrae]|uniref:Integral membrane protein n=1 Tax=Cellulomonas terrae TaxID=311234 RepID=A0A511JQ99_9CELL|nr:hypothetical protein [Cellulomonas terrae]GEM00202.1 hypothetical protein CTE05_37480 [Cellulomonas terrae]
MSTPGSAPSGDDRTSPAPHILELRIHGVANTPPAGMLEVGADEVQQLRGDTLGSFWGLTPKASARARRLPRTHQDHVPADVHREAYSWGQMARESAALPKVGTAGLTQRLSRAGWLLLLPLGLANTAYWSRRLTTDVRTFARGAGPIRVFGLGLTLLVVASVLTVSVDLIATQCFDDDGSRCSALPSVLNSLEGFTWSQRLAVLSVLPLAVILLLLWLSAGSRVRYEQPTSTALHETDSAQGWQLAQPGTWSRWGLTSAMARLHFAGGLALIVITLAAADVWGGSSTCRDLGRILGTPECLALDGYVGARPVSAFLFLLGLVVLAYTFRLVWGAQHRTMPTELSGWRPRATIVFALAVGAYLVEVVTLWGWGRAQSPHDGLLGMAFVPATLIAVLLAIALVATTWRAAAGWTWLAWAGVLLLAVYPVAAVLDRSGSERYAGPLAIAGVVVLVVCLRPWRRRGTPEPRESEGWRGAAPAVFLVLALGAVVALTSLVVVAAGDWLNGTAAAQCLAVDTAGGDASELCPAEGSATPATDAAADDRANLLLPPTYPIVAASTVLAFVVTVVLGGATAVWAWCAWRFGRYPGARTVVTGARTGLPEKELDDAAREDHEIVQPAGTLAELFRRPELDNARARTRQAAAAAKRAELLLGCFAFGVLAALVLALWWVSVHEDVETPPDWVTPLISVGLWTIALVWTALVLRVVTQNAPGRPVGLVWDLMCFLPRSAHPFGPPCYAERAVPELAARVRSWLDGDTGPDGAARGQGPEPVVVLSAHSLGAVLAVATIFTEPPERVRGRVGLLTYGAQLRPFFGRFFPELLGPDVLGTVPCPAPRIRWPEPWSLTDEEFPPERVPAGQQAARPESLVARLGGDGTRAHLPAWVSLWRSTDPLGMPVASDGPNFVDRGAEEIDATAFVATVGTHGGYPRTPAYRRAFEEVLQRVRDADPTPSDRAGGTAARDA